MNDSLDAATQSCYSTSALVCVHCSYRCTRVNTSSRISIALALLIRALQRYVISLIMCYNELDFLTSCHSLAANLLSPLQELCTQTYAVVLYIIPPSLHMRSPSLSYFPKTSKFADLSNIYQILITGLGFLALRDRDFLNSTRYHLSSKDKATWTESNRIPGMREHTPH